MNEQAKKIGPLSRPHDHLLCATSGEYYGIISPGLQMELYL